MSGFDVGYKIIITGNSSVGKSSILSRFVDNNFDSNLLATIGVDFKFRTLHVGNKKVRLQFWDTAGTQTFRSIVSAYYRGADAIVLVYSIIDQYSWKDLSQYWINEVHKYKMESCEIMIIGNKSDKKQQGKVNQEEVKQFLVKENIQLWFLASAATGENIHEAFEKLTMKLINKLGEGHRQKKQGILSIKNKKNIPSDQNVNQKKSCCGH